MFFSNEQNKTIIVQFIQRVEHIEINDEIASNRLKSTLVILNHMVTLPMIWDEKCKFNIKHIGDQLIGRLRTFTKNESNLINDIYIILYRFLRELDLSSYLHVDLEHAQRYMESELIYDSDDASHSFNSQMIYASYMMPINIFKECLNNPKLSYFENFESTADRANKLKETWDVEINAKKVEVTALKDKLDEYKTAFNFVGLNDGFKSLSTQKESEAKYSFWALFVMALLIIAPLCLEVLLNWLALNENKSIGIDRMFILVPLLSIEVILIYFFRVLLNNHRSVKAQLMQLELRQTLCQFIQSYTEYSAQMKKNDSVSLEKFENIIFSGIISNSEKLPSAFDGMDQIAKLMKNVKRT
ncbi:hypothetical protein [Moritella sp. Urea-trap-13]|uniref:hypothetical protein n=1 Tax=Moritella sp. Urea-trap-13 TaxID=2058327 RepID=UPI000C337023|nr:hypothetical protein [Moritella sp. Urea-trap-13]PKH06418.1 hypothetical protein CXF93_10915 [Moritella sp. Urea-trap-13]